MGIFLNNCWIMLFFRLVEHIIHNIALFHIIYPVNFKTSRTTPFTFKPSPFPLLSSDLLIIYQGALCRMTIVRVLLACSKPCMTPQYTPSPMTQYFARYTRLTNQTIQSSHWKHQNQIPLIYERQQAGLSSGPSLSPETVALIGQSTQAAIAAERAKSSSLPTTSISSRAIGVFLLSQHQQRLLLNHLQVGLFPLLVEVCRCSWRLSLPCFACPFTRGQHSQFPWRVVLCRK